VGVYALSYRDKEELSVSLCVFVRLQSALILELSDFTEMMKPENLNTETMAENGKIFF
jgi:hypothetical protein